MNYEQRLTATRALHFISQVAAENSHEDNIGFISQARQQLADQWPNISQLTRELRISKFEGYIGKAYEEIDRFFTGNATHTTLSIAKEFLKRSLANEKVFY